MTLLQPISLGVAAVLAAMAGAVFPVEPDCPEGAEMVGSAPPAGGERYCRKLAPDGRAVRHGWYTAWFPGGRKAVEGEYLDGKRTGQWLRFWEDGGKFEDLTFRQGRLDGPYRSWHRTGELSASGQYREHWQDGHWVFWHETGARAAEGDYEAGFQQGRWAYWKPDGHVRGAGDYRDGVMLKGRSSGLAGPDEAGRMPAVLEAGRMPKATEASRNPALGASHGDLKVSVDSRIELLSAVLSLTSWPELGPWTQGDTDYARDMRLAFEGQREHAAVRMLDALVQDGFTFDVPLRWILHYGPPPALELRTPLGAYVRRRGGGEKVLGDLAAALRAFARDARFMAFYERHGRYYDRLAGAYRHAAPPSPVPVLLESYFGTRKDGYHAIVAPMLGTRAYAFRLGGAAGPEHEALYSVAAPHDQQAGHFAFDPAQVRAALYRDFNRAFTEPAIERAYGAGYRTDLYAQAKPDMDGLGLVTWRWALTELAVRAAEIRLLRLHGFEAEARELLREGTAVDRFAWLPYAAERLEEYEGERARYPAFESFGHRFLGILDDTDAVTVSGRLMFLLRR